MKTFLIPMQVITPPFTRLCRSPSRSQFQYLALPALFGWFGMTMGSWAGRIPALREALSLSHSMLSLVLVCGGIGAVISYPLSSRMLTRLGGSRTLLYGGLALLSALISIGIAPSLPLLMLAVLALGISASCFDVGINSVATEVEIRGGKPIMARLHGFGCAGGLIGASLSSVMASQGIAPSMHFVLVALPFALLLWSLYGLLEHSHTGKHGDSTPFCLPGGPLVLLGALGFLGAMSEGSIADWSGIFLKDHFNVSDGVAPLSLSVFAFMMLLTRLCGDKLKGKYGAQRLVAWGALISAAGLFIAVFSPNPACALAGFALAGLGLALLFPFVFSAAGREGPGALAGVATMAYSGGLLGPPVIGALADGMGMQVAIGFIGTLSIGIAILASKTATLK